MSASREKKIRQDLESSGFVDPKSEKAAQQKIAETRANRLYACIAVIFVLIVAAILIWRSNMISRSATAATINGENYNAAEVTFYYQNAYRGFVNQNSYFISYMGLDTSASLKGQTVNATAASMLGLEEGSSWHDYFLDMGLQQMAAVQTALDQAAQEGFVYPDSVQAEYENSMATLKSSAETAGQSVETYLKSGLGSLMTEKIYGEQVMKFLQYSAYVDAYENSLTYTDAELEAAYKENADQYDLVSYEYVMFKGTAASTTDADGNTIQPTDEENAAAKEAAKVAAEALLNSYKGSASSLKALAANDESSTYKKEDGASYYGDTLSAWLFNSARKAGDCEVLEVGTSYYVVNFLNRHRDDSAVIDVRHILFQTETGTIESGVEGYEAEQATLKAAAKAKADDLLAQWKSGEATEESFAALAGEYTEDPGSKYTGGLYEEVTPGTMVAEFNDWCFDSSRKPGDTGVVETSYGAHVMYFVRAQVNWIVAVRSDLSSDATSVWAQNFVDNADIQAKDFGMKFVG